MKKNENEKVDVPKLNEVIKTGGNILKVAWVLMIISLVVLLTYLLKEWKILHFVGSVISIISPLFIGVIIAWLLDPLVGWLQKNGVKRAVATVIVYLTFLSILVLFFVIMIPALAEQINEFIGFAPNVLDYLKSTAEDVFSKMTKIYAYDFTSVKEQLYASLSGLFESITVGLPNKLISFASSFLSGGLNFIFGLFVGFYMLFDFNNVRKHLLNLLPKKLYSDAITLTDALDKTLKSYVQGTLLIMLMLFIFQSVALAIAGLSSPMLFGLFCVSGNITVGGDFAGSPRVNACLLALGTLLSNCIGTTGASMLMVRPVIKMNSWRKRKRHIMGGILLSVSFLFGGLAITVMTIRNEEEDDEQ